VLMIGVIVGWVFVLAFLLAIGSVIGLIVGIIILINVMGWLDVTLTRYFWHIRVDSGWTALLAHGFVLFIALLLVSIPQLIVSALIPSVITSIVLFIVYCFVDGFVAKNVAEKIFDVFDACPKQAFLWIGILSVGGKGMGDARGSLVSTHKDRGIPCRDLAIAVGLPHGNDRSAPSIFAHCFISRPFVGS
jgi:hypothetical protein